MIEMVNENCSVSQSEGKMSFVVKGRLSRLQESLLFAWFFLWVILGSYAIYELVYGGQSAVGEAYERELKLTMVVYTVLWTYFFYRIGKALLWSRIGCEYILMTDESISIKKAYGGYGKAREFDWDNIESLRVVERDEMSFQQQMESSFWVVGGERIMFEHFKSTHGFGRKLSDRVALNLFKRMKAFKKSIPAVSQG